MISWSDIYDIIALWYHMWYYMIYVLISCMISCMISVSCLYDIRAHITNVLVWYQRWYQRWYHTWWQGVYTNSRKRACIERCRSRALQVQAQDVQNRRRWSSALLEEARLVLGVRRFRPRRRVSQSGVVRARRAPHQACPVFLVVRQRRHRRPTVKATKDFIFSVKCCKVSVDVLKFQ